MLHMAMPKIIRQIGKFDWGFFSETEVRMHLQALGKKMPDYKVWLESSGKRCFVDAHLTNPMPSQIYTALEAAVAKQRGQIENMWINMQIDLGHIAAKVLDPSNYIFDFVLYPGQNTELHRRVELPGLRHKDQDGLCLKNRKFDSEKAAITFGTHLPEEKVYDLYLPDIFWGRRPD